MHKTASVLVFSLVLWAQPNRRMTGNVTDGNGAALPGATITVTSGAFRAVAVTNSDGQYVVNAPPGNYTVAVTLEGFGSAQALGVGIPTDRDRYFDFVLDPAPIGEDIFVVSTSDAASGRPGVLPESELAQGTRFNAYGRFGVTEGVVAQDSPLPFVLNGLNLTLVNDSGDLLKVPLSLVGPSEVTGIIPSVTAPGVWNLTATNGDRISRPAPVNVVAYRPTIFTRNLLGFGTAVATDADGAPITFTNPARPGGTYSIKITNFGAVPEDGVVINYDKREEYSDYAVKLASRFIPKDEINYFGAAESPGTGLVVFRLPVVGTIAGDTGCGVPVQVGVRVGEEPFRWSNQATLPISPSGACGDILGFGPDDLPRLSGDGIAINDTAITEATQLSTTRVDRVFGRMVATRWTDSTYTPPAPIGTCSYRWEPFGLNNRLAPSRLPLAGAASMTIPWGQFAFSPASNAGPFSLAFATPANFSEGNFTLDYSNTFAVDAKPFQFRAVGAYQRRSGSMRTTVADRAAQFSFFRTESLDALVARLWAAQSSAPTTLRESLFADLNIFVDHGTRGRHVARCILDPLEPFDLQGVLGTVLPQMPQRANNVDVTLRWFDRNPINHTHTGAPLDRSNILFDSYVTVVDVPTVR